MSVPPYRAREPLQAQPQAILRRLPGLFLCRGMAEVLPGIADLIGPLVPFDFASLALFDPARRRLRILEVAPAGAKGERSEERFIPLDGTAAASSLRDRQPRRFAASEPGSSPDLVAPLFRQRPGSALIIPLFLEDRPLGTLNLGALSPNGFGEEAAGIAAQLVPYLAVALENVSAYQRARQSEDRYRGLLEHAPAAVFVIDLDERRLAEVNARAVDLTGYSRSELMAMLPGEAEPPASPTCPFRFLRALLRDGLVQLDTEIVRADHTSLPVSVHASLLRVGGSRLVHCEVHDISQRVLQERSSAREREISHGLLDKANLFICTLDRRGRIGMINRRFQEALGLRQEDLVGADALPFVPPADRNALRDRIRAAFRGEHLADAELTLVSRDGGSFVLSAGSSVLRDEGGRPRELLLIGTDITASKRFAAGLVASERRSKSSYQQLREFSAVSSNILQERDLDRICGILVQALREHSNFRRSILTLLDDQFRGYKWFFAGLSEEEIQTFHRNRLTRDQRVTIFQEQFRLGNSYYIPHDSGWQYVGVPSTRSTGEMLDWHPDDFLFIPLYGSNRKMVGIVSVDDPRDGARPTAETISPIELFANQVAHSIEQAKLDLEVRRSTEKYRTLVDSMNDGLLMVDLTNRVTFVNPALAELLGYPEHTMLQRSVHRFFSEEHREVFRREVRQRERRSRFELAMVARSGEAIPVMVSASPFYQNSQLVGTFAIISDLREQKEAERASSKMHQEIVEANTRLKASMEELSRAQEQLIQAEKLSALGELVSGVAHELNNPLTGVMGFSQLLMRADCSEGVKEDLAKIHKEAVRCQKIVQNLLTFARRHAPERSLVQINDVLAATLELRAYQLKVDNIEVVCETDPKLPETLVDFHQIQQVFINIINNAHQAMLDAHGRGRLILRTERAGDSIRVSFTDDGPGIPEEKVGKIFDPFFTTKEPGKGTGLGLSLSYGIIRDHDGRIFASGAPGRGTRFVVELPIRQAAAAAALPEKAEPPRASGVPRKRILVVDDEEVILELLGAILQAEGHEVDTARNGRVAIEKIKAGHFDLIISDLKMPDLGGQGLWESVRAIDPDLSRRMIFSTGDTVNPSTLAFFRKAGNPVLSKPFRIEEVDQTIRRALSGGQSIH